MSRDPYEPCPCGSGNKLKFCCADVAAEMEKVERLLTNNQPHMAIQSMEKLRETESDSQWVNVCLASTLINDDKAKQAKQVLKPLLKAHPEQPFANVLYALASYNADGYPACRRAAHRAFKQSLSAFPDLVGTLASAVADSLLGDGKVMGARQYLVLAMRLANEEHRRALFEELMELDGDTTIPYPLRGVRQPMEFAAEGEDERSAQLAARLAMVGCFDEAADTLATLAQERPEDPRLRYNIGLFHAWAGDHARAIDSFRQAADLFDTQEESVECEVLAQLLEQSDPERGTAMRLRRYDLDSVSQLLSTLDEAEGFVRVDREQDPPSSDSTGPVARYVLLSRTLQEEERYSDWTWETVPLIEGRLTVFDRDPQGEQPAQAFLVGLEGDELDRSLAAFTAAAGDLAHAVEPDETDEPDADVTGYVPESELPLRWSGFVPPDAPGEIARQTARQRWGTVVEEIWPNQKLPALNHQTPLEASANPALRSALEAALTVFDAYADSRNYMLPLDRMRDRLSLPSPGPLEVDEQTHVNALSALQMHRLPLSSLSDSQYEQLLRRATLIKHGRLLYNVLQEALERPDQTSQPEARDRVLATIAGICGNSLQHEETLEWIQKGKAVAADRADSFEALLEWKMRELALRIENPEDSDLPELLNDLWHNYGAKLPQLREYLVTLVDVSGVKAPWESAIVTPAGSVAGGDPGWSAPQDSGDEKKLWLPGDGE